MGTYRDQEGAVRARLETVEEAIAEAEAKLSEDFWNEVAPELELEPSQPGDREISPERLAEREQHLTALQSVLANLGDIEARWAHAAGSVAPIGEDQPASALTLFWAQTLTVDAKPLPFEHEWARTLRSLRRYVPNLVLPRRKGPRWGASVRIDETPIDVQIAAVRSRRNTAFTHALASSVSRAAGPFRLEPEGIMQDLFEMLGLRREIELDDATFDPVFLIRGHEDTVRTMLTPLVRNSLLLVSAEGPLRLFVDSGRALLRTGAGLSEGAVDAALSVMVALHEARIERPLRSIE